MTSGCALHIALADIVAPGFRVGSVQVLLDHRIQHAFRRQDEVDSITARACATGKRRDVVRHALHLLAGVRRGNRQAHLPHDRQIDDVVADIGEFFQGAALRGKNLLYRFHLVRLALVDVLDPQVMRAHGNRLRHTFGDETELQPRKPSKRHAESIVRVEAFDLDTFAVGLRNDRNVAVGKDAVDVEKKDLDVTCALDSSVVGHQENDTGAASGTQ